MGTFIVVLLCAIIIVLLFRIAHLEDKVMSERRRADANASALAYLEDKMMSERRRADANASALTTLQETTRHDINRLIAALYKKGIYVDTTA